ncbi:hypothetical protein [Mucilaginibacter glaciei]|uniref:Uncharacterized protein n=1 Tax=Mucilaginibacter glaciei TaxID=2772109 RepID=A0A926NLH6_9SPHI|nr:hypothetical protein [Mucilaginibacter glaciei]MBD1394289.1 hypothetical protein [Mucilaginibacter glaciei]
MTIKLTYQQAVALKEVFDKVIIPEVPYDMAESPLKDIMTSVYKKLRARLEAKKKDGYSISLTDIEGKAYYLYFQNRHLGTGWTYEENLITQQINLLDKTYA